MSEPTNKFSLPRDSEIIRLRNATILSRIAAGEQISRVARDLNISDRNIYARLRRSDGLQMIRDAVADANALIRSRLPDLVSKSLDVLESQLSASDPDRRARAARAILSVAARFAEASRPNTGETTGQVIDSTTITRAKEGPHNDL